MSIPDLADRLRLLARAQRVLAIAGAITIVGLIFLTVVLYGDNKATERDVDALQSNVSTSRADRAVLRGDVTSLQDALDVANQKLAAAGKTLVQPPLATATQPRALRYVPIPGPRGPRGPMPPPAKDGTDGTNGKTVVGPKGDSVTGPPGESIVGPKGDSITGDPGKPGRGITSIQCADDGRFRFTFSDDTSTTIGDPGTCRTQPVVPTP